MRCAHFVRNQATQSIMNVITRNRAQETRLQNLDEMSKKQEETYFIREEPSVTFDVGKYGKIYFFIDDRTHLTFKRLQMKMQKKIDFNNTPYELQKIDGNFEMCIVPRINFQIANLRSMITEILDQCREDYVYRIAVNFGISAFKTYFEMKMEFQTIFKGSDVTVTFHLGKQTEIFDVDEINEILKLYHTPILGGHRGFERMKNTQ